MYKHGIAVVSAYQQMNFLGQGFRKLEHYTDKHIQTHSLQMQLKTVQRPIRLQQ